MEEITKEEAEKGLRVAQKIVKAVDELAATVTPETTQAEALASMAAIYDKYESEMPDDILREFAQAVKEAPDTKSASTIKSECIQGCYETFANFDFEKYFAIVPPTPVAAAALN